jgi:allantoinase
MKPAAYGPFAYRPILGRPPFRLPGGARVALWVVPNVEFFALNQPVPEGTGKVPDVPNWAKRDYGNRIGFFRMKEVMDRHDVPGTVALNSDLCDHHPQIVDACVKQKWEFMGHCQSNSSRLNQVPAETERSVIKAPPPARGPRAGSAPACRRPGRRSIIWRMRASNTSPTGSTTISPTR